MSTLGVVLAVLAVFALLRAAGCLSRLVDVVARIAYVLESEAWQKAADRAERERMAADLHPDPRRPRR